jgi:hypothetical protein
MKNIFVIIIALLFISCTPQQRLSRILRNHPDLMKHDTMIVKDTIRLPGFVVDSSFYCVTGDTITIEKERVKVRLIYIHDTLKINVKQRPDTIYTEKKVIVNKVIEVKIPWYKDKVNIGLIIAGILLLLIIIWLLKKK